MSDSKYADEGTIAHALAAMCLREKKPASAYIGRLIVAEDYEHASLSPSGAPRWMRCAGSHALISKIKFKPRKFSHQVDDEMAAGVQVYLDSLAKFVSEGDDVLIEKRLPIDHLTAEVDATGTGDTIVLKFTGNEIQAHDLKFGKGVPVFAEKNEQLAMYLSSTLRVFEEFAPEGGWKTFRGVIHQPRMIFDEPSEYVWTLEDLRAFESECKSAAWLANKVKAGGTAYARDYLVVGEKQCKFCPAKATCPALAKAAQEVVFAEFPDLDAEPGTDVVPVDAAQGARTAIPADLDKLARLYKLVPLAESFFAAVAAEMEARLLAGEQHPDFKVVQGRKGNRAWTSEAEAEEMLKKMRVKHDQMYKYSVLSPTQVEEKLVKCKVLGDRQWEKLKALIGQAPGRPTVVPVSDHRPALDIKPVVEHFEALDAPPTNPEDLV